MARKTQERKRIELMAQFIYLYAENVKPEIKHSERNVKVASAALALQDLAKLL